MNNQNSLYEIDVENIPLKNLPPIRNWAIKGQVVSGFFEKHNNKQLVCHTPHDQSSPIYINGDTHLEGQFLLVEINKVWMISSGKPYRRYARVIGGIDKTEHKLLRKIWSGAYGDLSHECCCSCFIHRF